MIALYVIGTALGLWIVFCGAVWVWYSTFGADSDASGDIALAILSLPFIPFFAAWYGLKKLFGRS